MSALGVGVGPSSQRSGLTTLCGYNFDVHFKFSEGGGKRKTGVGAFGSGLAILSWTLGWAAFCGNN